MKFREIIILLLALAPALYAADPTAESKPVVAVQAAPFTPADYEKNLEQLVTRLEATGAKLIWANTTVVPEGEAGRFVGDDEKYNAIAARVMKKHCIATDDLFTLTKGFAGKYSTKAGDVHFTTAGYEKLDGQIAATIEELLTNKTEP